MKKNVITLLVSAFFMTSAANARMDPSNDGIDRTLKPGNTLPVAVGIPDDGMTDVFSVPDPYSPGIIMLPLDILSSDDKSDHPVYTVYPEVRDTSSTELSGDTGLAATITKIAADAETHTLRAEQHKIQAQGYAEIAGNYAGEAAGIAESVKNSHDTINNNAASVQSLEMRSQVLAESQATVTDTVSNLTGRVNNVVKKQSATSRVADNNARAIDKITERQKTNTRHILENRHDIRAIEQALRETSERLDNGLAASAALNGLFQPYGVGKLNITAAMGGYQSTQAVAVGTGYRFNENIAVKTGVAYTGSNDVMYNMAFNLEW